MGRKKEIPVRELANRLRLNCLDCVGAGPRTVNVVCSTEFCSMYQTMRRHFRDDDDMLATAARNYCLECMGGIKTLVRHCSQTSCRMYPVRDKEAQGEG